MLNLLLISLIGLCAGVVPIPPAPVSPAPITPSPFLRVPPPPVWRPPRSCVEMGAFHLTRYHECECKTDVDSNCGEDESHFYCKSLEFVIHRLGDTPSIEYYGLCPDDAFCCCHC
eukprot:940297_1